VKKLEGKVALVTGSGRGVGRSIALKLASEGAFVVVNDLDDEAAVATRRAICAAGGEAEACLGSVVAPDFGERFVGVAVDKYMGLDIIVNNAGHAWDNAIRGMADEQQWRAMIDVHLAAPLRILQAALPVIHTLDRADRDAGNRTVRKVVNISSVAGLFGSPGQVGYSTAKAGVAGMTMSLAREWGRLNTTVNCVAYGYIKSGLAATTDDSGLGSRKIRAHITADILSTVGHGIPLGRRGTPEEAAGAVYMFCIPESDYVSGQTLLCSGGLTGI
jgi:3-oxoacyl-[acyl-carrier protein] reductase